MRVDTVVLPEAGCDLPMPHFVQTATPVVGAAMEKVPGREIAKRGCMNFLLENDTRRLREEKKKKEKKKEKKEDEKKAARMRFFRFLNSPTSHCLHVAAPSVSW
jgi:hypothetical protein